MRLEANQGRKPILQIIMKMNLKTMLFLLATGLMMIGLGGCSL
jgi:hypothetical protein